MILVTLYLSILTIISHTPLNEYSTIYFDSLILKYCQSVAITNHAANFLLLCPGKQVLVFLWDTYLGVELLKILKYENTQIYKLRSNQFPKQVSLFACAPAMYHCNS